MTNEETVELQQLRTARDLDRYDGTLLLGQTQKIRLSELEDKSIESFLQSAQSIDLERRNGSLSQSGAQKMIFELCQKWFIDLRICCKGKPRNL